MTSQVGGGMNRYIIRKISGRWIVARGCRILHSCRSWEKAIDMACWFARLENADTDGVITQLARRTP